jgi:hypothetical protein
MGNKIDVSALTEWAPYEGFGTQDLLSEDGSFKLKITKSRYGTSKAGREMITLAFVVEDADNKGKQLIHNVVIGGDDRNGKPMIRQLGDLFHSLGKTPEEIKAYGKQGSLDIEAIVSKMEGKSLYARCAAEAYDGEKGRTISSKVANLITKEAFEADVETGTHRKAHTYAGIDAEEMKSAPKNGAAPAKTGGKAKTQEEPAIDF